MWPPKPGCHRGQIKVGKVGIPGRLTMVHVILVVTVSGLGPYPRYIYIYYGIF